MARLGADFGRLWAAYAISAAGSTVSYGALGLIAVLVLDAPAWQVSLITAISAVASAVLVFPLGPRVEFSRKRPAMITSDLVRFAALASVPAAAALHVLTMTQLYVVDVVTAMAFVVFASASGAHLKALLADPADRAVALSRFESTDWLCYSVGPPLGGVLITAVGATFATLLDAVSFLLSALGVRRLRTPEPPPPVRVEGRKREDLTEGWRYLLTHRDLRPLFLNAVLFSGAVLWVSPLETVFMLRDLGFAPWMYGLVMGLPCLGGLVGAWLAPKLSARFGARRVIRWTGVLRTPWLLAVPFAVPGPIGVVVLATMNFGLLLVAGIFNPTYAAHRLNVTRDDVVARVVGAWSIGTRSVKPLFIVAGGALAAVTDVRTALFVGGALCLVSAVILPSKDQAASPELSHAK